MLDASADGDAVAVDAADADGPAYTDGAGDSLMQDSGTVADAVVADGLTGDAAAFHPADAGTVWSCVTAADCPDVHVCHTVACSAGHCAYTPGYEGSFARCPNQGPPPYYYHCKNGDCCYTDPVYNIDYCGADYFPPGACGFGTQDPLMDRCLSEHCCAEIAACIVDTDPGGCACWLYGEGGLFCPVSPPPADALTLQLCAWTSCGLMLPL